MKSESIHVIVSLLLGFSAAAQTNQWTKASSGYWEEPYWSLGRLPGIDQQLVVFNNTGWKALAIGQNTTAIYPQSLSLNNLLVDGPANSSNTLLLNWAGLSVPLVVHSNLTIGTNGSLVSHYSALQAANAYIDGSASFSDFSTEELDQLWLRSGATLNLMNGIMTCSNLTFFNGMFTQSGGSHVAQNIILPGIYDQYSPVSGAYYFQGGALTSQHLALGYARAPFGPDGPGTLWQSGGFHTNYGMTLQGYYHPGSSTLAGQYHLDGGVLVSSSIANEGGYFVQNGGTNFIQELDVTGGSRFELHAGQLITSNVTINVDPIVPGTFVQTGGIFVVSSRLQIGSGYTGPAFQLGGGALVTSNIYINGGELSLSSQGTVSNMGIIAISGYVGGDIRNPANVVAKDVIGTQYLGQLQISSGATLQMHYPFSPPTNATVLRFNDSHSLPWTGPLQISFWGAIPGDHIFVGTNAQGLTDAQLVQVQFVDLNSTNPAVLLSTGELVPLLAGTNEWTKPTSGAWEESYWSLGRLPAIDQQFVAVNNSGWKAVAIGQNTTSNYPQSLSLNSLLVDGPANSRNTLLLNWAGLSVPLVVHSNLTIGTNGSLVSHYSALKTTNAYIDGSASFSDYSTEDFGQLWLRSGATVILTNGLMTCSNLTFYTAIFTQHGGTHAVQSMNIPMLYDLYNWPSAKYYLQGGTLISQQLSLGAGGGQGPEGHGSVVQSGGVHTNGSMSLAGWTHTGGAITLGSYTLDDGLLVSGSIHINDGHFSQTGGTNLIRDLNVEGGGGGFELSGGELITSNVTAYVDPFVNGLGFDQTGGMHTVRGRLLVQGGWPYLVFGVPTYELAGGKLVTTNIEIQSGSLRFSSEGTVSNAGVISISGGDIIGNDAAGTQYLGQLLCSGGNLDVHDPHALYKPTVWCFADSHALLWSGPLHVNNWGLHSGDHIFFGTNAESLTAAQLAEITFMENGTNSPARLLATGELVPVIPPSLACSNAGNALVLSWPGNGYDLLSATNVNGPYLPVPAAASPFTNTYSEPGRYFRLRTQLP